MKKISFLSLFLFLFFFGSNAQKPKNIVSYVDENRSSGDAATLSEMITYFTDLVKQGKIKAYNGYYTDNGKDRPLTMSEFNQILEGSKDTMMQRDPVTSEDKIIIVINPINVTKIRITSEMVFNETTKQMDTVVKELDFLCPVNSSEGQFMGFTQQFYLKF